MREGVVSLREPAPAPRRAGIAPRRGFFRRHRDAWLLGLGGTLLMAGVGAFGTGQTAPWTRVSYWAILMVAGSLLAALGLEAVEASGRYSEQPVRKGAVLTLALSLPFVPLVWVMSALALGADWDPGRMIHLVPQVLLVAGLFVALQMFLLGRQRRAADEPPATGEPALLARFPENLRGAALHAVEAEDHYLRLHTDRGSALILMRLGDAVAELEGMEGAQTHRSWWVAKAAVLGASRSGGRATLRLAGGVMAPVSRTYAPALRRAGWFGRPLSR